MRRADGCRFQLIAGHRRFRAFKLLRDRSDAFEERRFSAIPALVKAHASDEEMARLALNENRVKRLLRLHEAPPFIRQAVSDGLVIENEGRRIQRKLDLMGALEFARFFRESFTRDSKRAESRVRAAIERCLTEGWGFRRIEAHVQAELDRRPAATTREPHAAAPKQREPVFSRRGSTLSIDLSREQDVTTAERIELRALLKAFVAQ